MMWIAIPELNRNREYLIAYREGRWLLTPVPRHTHIDNIDGPIIYAIEFRLPLADLVEMVSRWRESNQGEE